MLCFYFITCENVDVLFNLSGTWKYFIKPLIKKAVFESVLLLKVYLLTVMCI